MGLIINALPLIISLVYMGLIRNIPSGSFSDPGPGLYPFVIGVFATIISLFVLVSEFKSKFQIVKEEKLRFPTVAFVMTFVITCLVFNIFGTLISLIIFILTLFKVAGVMGWRRPVILGFIFVLTLYGLFYYWFNIPFPQGILADLMY